MSEPFEPSIQVPVRLRPRALSTSSRLALTGMAAAIVVVFCLAWWLEPNQRGYGTHEQLGLPPCAFRALTGVRCPSCGMTTSFSYAVRGRLDKAAAANFAGCLLALAAALLCPWCLASAVLGRTLGLRSPERALVIAIVALVGTSVMDWAVRYLFLWGQR